jgi:hypothetical protein
VPFGVSSFSSAVTSTPYFLAKPAAAGDGAPSFPTAADIGGPVTRSSRSVWRSASLAIRAVSRRGVLKVSIVASGNSRSSFKLTPNCMPSSAVSPGSQPAGISSQPISSSSSRSID